MRTRTLIVIGVLLLASVFGTITYFDDTQTKTIQFVDEIIKQQSDTGYFITSCFWEEGEGWKLALGTNREEQKFEVKVKDYHPNFNDIMELCNRGLGTKVESSGLLKTRDWWALITRDYLVLIARRLKFNKP